MKAFQEKSDADLIKFIEEKREELHKLRFGTAGSGMRNTHAIRDNRHETARALTELKARTVKGA